MIEYFVNVAKECINIGNFNSLMAIIGEREVTWSSSSEGQRSLSRIGRDGPVVEQFDRCCHL